MIKFSRLRLDSINLLFFTALLTFVIPQAAYSENLQLMINNAPKNSVIKLRNKIYSGPIVINKPITIDGNNSTIIDGGGKGTVITIRSDGVTIENLIIRDSGDLGYKMDAGITIYSSNNHIIHNRVKNCLYGIVLKRANNNKIIGNNISSKPYKETGLRGDGFRLWWSNNNLLKDNYMHDARDFVVWFCKHNTIIGERSVRSRYGIHFMYSNYDTVIDYKGSDNMVGIYLMYVKHVKIQNVIISNNNSITGIGIGMKDASYVLIKNTRITHCTRAIYLHESPYEPGSKCKFINDGFYYNGIALYFNVDATRNQNIFTGDNFIGNIKDISVTGGMIGHPRGFWNKNYWDRYRGFDENSDGVGDTPYLVTQFSGSLTRDYPNLRLFEGSPLFLFINFIKKLIPFSQPINILIDKNPLMEPVNNRHRDL